MKYGCRVGSQKVKTLTNEQTLPGYHVVKWDGTNDKGILVSTLNDAESSSPDTINMGLKTPDRHRGIILMIFQ